MSVAKAEPSIDYLVEIARQDGCTIELVEDEIRITGPTHDLWREKLLPRAEELRRYLSGEPVDDAEIPPDPHAPLSATEELDRHLNGEPKDDAEIDPPLSATGLFAKYPTKREIVIDGILRHGETMNVIAAPKRGKSWLVYGLGLSVATGRDWLGHETHQGNVLLVDNELHPEELSHRLSKVAGAMAVPDEVLNDRFKVRPVRGDDLDIMSLDQLLGYHTAAGDPLSLVIIDAFYRFLPGKMSENDNNEMKGVYNRVDAAARKHDCSIVLVHHASKGDQSGKEITDVGSGAGVISRAADTHLILRSHKLEDCVVLDGVVRSFPPLSPVTASFEWPLWSVKDIPAELKQRDTANDNRNKETDDAILAALSGGKPLSRNKLVESLPFGISRVKNGLVRLVADGKVQCRKKKVKGQSHSVELYRLPPTAYRESGD